METSAYQSFNIDKAFSLMFEEILKKFKKNTTESINNSFSKGVNLKMEKETEKTQKKKKCC